MQAELDIGTWTAITLEALSASSQIWSEEAYTQLEGSLKEAIAAGFVQRMAKNAHRVSYDKAEVDKKSGLTFDEFDKYVTFALKAITLLWSCIVNAAGTVRYKRIWDMVTGRTTITRDPDQYEEATNALESATTLG